MGNATALYQLGVCYLEGEICPKNSNSAIELLRMASEKGSMKAINKLGLIYIYGIGVPRDMEMSKHYLETGIQNNDSESMYMMSVYYFELCRLNNQVTDVIFFDLVKDTLRNDSPARREVFWLRKSANEGYSGAQRALGMRCEHRKDKSESIYWYKIACSQNEPVSCNNLAKIYFKGEDVLRDVSLSFKLWVKTINIQPDYLEALENLANCYEYGQGTPKDFGEANSLRMKIEYIRSKTK